MKLVIGDWVYIVERDGNKVWEVNTTGREVPFPITLDSPEDLKQFVFQAIARRVIENTIEDIKEMQEELFTLEATSGVYDYNPEKDLADIAWLEELRDE